MIYICEFWRTHIYHIIGVFLLEAKALPTTRRAGGLFYCHTNQKSPQIRSEDLILWTYGLVISKEIVQSVNHFLTFIQCRIEYTESVY